MAVPIENREYAERQRMKDRMEREVARDRITFGAVRGFICETPHFAEMQKAYYPETTAWKDEYESMGISGALGGVAAGAPTIVGSDYSAPTMIVVDIDEYTKFKADLTEAQKSLAERDEMIEALAADLEDIDALKEQIVQLHKLVDAPKPEPEFKHTEVSIPLPGSDWIEWHGGPSPIPTGRDFQVKFDTHDENYIYCSSGTITWEHDGHCIPITAYRLVP